VNHAAVLSWLLSPMDAGLFRRDHWGQRPCAISRRDGDYYASLFSMSDLDSVITLTGHAASPTRIRLVKTDNGELCSRPVPHTAGGSPDIYCLYRSYADEGYTITIDRLELQWRAIAALCRSLEQALHHPVVANLYVTPRRAQGFSAHYDTHEVFVLQLEGAKRWHLYGSAVPLPLADATSPAFARGTLGPPEVTVTLDAGDALYIPRGHVHEATTSDDPSLHLTVGVHVFRWVDLVAETVASVARRNPRFREALPIGFLHDASPEAVPVKERLRELLEVLVAEADTDQAVWRMAQRLLSNGQPVPDGHFRSLEQLEALGLDTLVERRAGMPCRVVVDQDRAKIHYPGNILVGPGTIEPALRFVASAGQFAVGDLPGLTEAEKLALAERLVREGFLAITRTGNGSGPEPERGPVG
jgi:ribosomal protein L16 Arg81 hydroxylase